MILLRWIALVIGVLLHVLAAWGLWHGDMLLPILAHVVGSLVWGFGAALLLPPGRPSAWLLPAGCALVFPVIGLPTSVVLILILRRAPKDRSDYRYLIWKDHAPPEWKETLPAGAMGQSIVEILQSPRTQLRRNAVLALRELDPQMAIPLLRKGLQDSDEQVRIYAQNILSAMLERFESSIKELEAQLKAHPDAALPARRLAEQFFELVYLDVAGDDETAAHYLGKALSLLEQAEAAAPGDPQTALFGLRYALRARKVDTARRWFARLDPREAESQHVLPWRMELAFLEQDWSELRALFTTFTQARWANPRIEELARYWLPQQSAAA